jgi:hypothetical protein
MRVDDTLLLPSSHRLFRERNSSKGGVNVDGRWQTSSARKSGTIKTKPLFLYDVPVQNRPTSLIVLPNTDQTSPSSSESIKASAKEENQMKVIMAGYAAAQKNVSVFISSLPEGSGPQHNLSNASNETTTWNSTSRLSISASSTPWNRPRSRFRANNLVTSPDRSRASGATAMKDAIILPELRASPRSAGCSPSDTEPYQPASCSSVIAVRPPSQQPQPPNTFQSSLSSPRTPKYLGDSDTAAFPDTASSRSQSASASRAGPVRSPPGSRPHVDSFGESARHSLAALQPTQTTDRRAEPPTDG